MSSRTIFFKNCPTERKCGEKNCPTERNRGEKNCPTERNRDEKNCPTERNRDEKNRLQRGGCGAYMNYYPVPKKLSCTISNCPVQSQIVLSGF